MPAVTQAVTVADKSDDIALVLSPAVSTALAIISNWALTISAMALIVSSELVANMLSLTVTPNCLTISAASPLDTAAPIGTVWDAAVMMPVIKPARSFPMVAVRILPSPPIIASAAPWKSCYLNVASAVFLVDDKQAATPATMSACAFFYLKSAFLDNFETAKLNAVDPHALLADTFARMPDYKITKVDDLLPWHWNR